MKTLFGLFVLAISMPVLAEVVVPIDSVEEHVNIRLSADPKSEIVGRLEQGASALLIASSEGWHEVEIVGGSTGFISADWTVVLAETPDLADEAVEQSAPAEIAAAISEPPLNDDSAEDVADDVNAGSESVTSDIQPAVAETALKDGVTVEQVVEDAVVESEVAEESAAATEAPVEDVAIAVEETAKEQPVTEAVAAEVDLQEPLAVADDIAAADMIVEPVQEPVIVVATPAPQSLPGPAGPPGPTGAATIKGTENFLVKFDKPEIGGNSTIYDDGNNVGIGTTDPKQRLEVNGSIQIHEQNSSVAGLMITQSSGDTGYIMHNRANTLTIGAGSVDRLTIDREGNVGVGVARPSHPLEMASGAHVTAGGVWTNSSSRSRKENISELGIDEALAALLTLQPVQFNYRNERQETYVGFIAEDVPDLVATNGRDSLSTMDLVAVLTKVVQAQQIKIEELETRLNSAK